MLIKILLYIARRYDFVFHESIDCYIVGLVNKRGKKFKIIFRKPYDA